MSSSAKMLRVAAAAAVLLVAACASDVAPRGAMLSAAPDAPGYMIVGLAEQNHRCEFGTTTRSFALRFKNDGGKSVVAGRQGCGLTTNGGEVLRSVLTVPAGRYRPDFAAEVLHVFVTDTTLKDDITNAEPIEVPAGHIVYAGDYILASDFQAQEIKLLRVEHDEAGAAAALAPYPSLFGASFVSAGGLRSRR